MQTAHKRGRPSLRGVSHAFAAIASVAAALALWRVSAGDVPKQTSMLVFGASMIGLYTSSATYHLGEWKGRIYHAFRRLDHAMIFFLIAGTYTPFCFNLLEGSSRVASLMVVWGLALAGAGTKILFPFLPRWISVVLYLGMGWCAVFKAGEFARVLAPGGMLLVLGGGLAYSVGAIIYAMKRPDPFPRIFGYHEVFHMLVISGTLMHFLALFFFVAPLDRI
ncbi:MAG: hemolysin III family protein [Myxococcota bacterium]